VAGDLQPFANRNPLLTGFLFPLQLSPGEHLVLLRISTPDPMLLPLRLLDDEQLEHLSLQRLTSYGLSYGFLLALIFYNTALFFGIRDRHHLLYALYLGSFLLVNLAYSGHGLAWFWSDATEWQRWAPPALMILFGCCGLLFATSFLHIRQHCSLGYRAAQLAAALALLSLSAGWLMDSQLIALSTAFVFMLVFTSLMLLMGLYRVTQGSVSARFYLLAVISGTCGTVITTLAVLGHLPLREWSFRAAEIGMLAEATLLALALAARIRHVQREQIQAEHAANTDPLTLLNNRRALYRLAESHWQTGNRRRRPLSAVVLDIDHFKLCNDTHGHAAGDRVLCQLGQCILNTVREGDLAARWGGEEFLILLPDTNLEDAGRFAARLLEQIRLTQLILNGRVVEVTASIGIAEQSEQDRSLDDLIGHADQALYEAKHRGRNRIFQQQVDADGNDQLSEVLISESAD
jgi:diguanylate cyclase (GGDEF)-like protein